MEHSWKKQREDKTCKNKRVHRREQGKKVGAAYLWKNKMESNEGEEKICKESDKVYVMKIWEKNKEGTL